MAGGLVYIVVYYLPQKIFLLEFKYALNGWTWRMWGGAHCDQMQNRIRGWGVADGRNPDFHRL
jgi:hypothetical protein